MSLVATEHPLVAHWSQLIDRVHPLDAPFMQTGVHSFNLDYPPPAFIGDIVNARVILLDANGGFDPELTPSEFMSVGAADRFLDLLHRPRAIHPGQISPYYGLRNFADLIATGNLALVNAVAYRSSSISRETENRRIAEKLPSTTVHRNWLRHTLLPSAARGDRLIVAHRTSLWKIKRSEGPLPGVIFTTNPVSADLSHEVLLQIRGFLV